MGKKSLLLFCNFLIKKKVKVQYRHGRQNLNILLKDYNITVIAFDRWLNNSVSILISSRIYQLFFRFIKCYNFRPMTSKVTKRIKMSEIVFFPSYVNL